MKLSRTSRPCKVGGASTPCSVSWEIVYLIGDGLCLFVACRRRRAGEGAVVGGPRVWSPRLVVRQFTAQETSERAR